MKISIPATQKLIGNLKGAGLELDCIFQRSGVGGGGGRQTKTAFCRRGMDIFWNIIFSNFSLLEIITD